VHTSAVIPAILLLSGAACAQQAGFWLPGLPAGSSGGSVQGLSQNGLVAVGATGTGAVTPGFTWTATGGRVDFGLQPGMPAHTFAADVNSGGETIVGWMMGTSVPQQRAYRRMDSGPLESLGVLPNETRSLANGVSGDGTIVVGNAEHDVPGPFPGTGGQAFRWTQGGGMQGLGYLSPNGYRSQAYGISRNGSVIVGTSQSNGAFGPEEAFRWTTAGGMERLPNLPNAPFPSYQARAANGNGTVIVGECSSPISGTTRAVRWTTAGVQDLGSVPGYLRSFAYAVDDSGSVIGGTTYSGLPTAAFVWTPTTGMTLLSDYLTGFGLSLPNDYRLEELYVVSGDGMTFGGLARNLTSNVPEGFVATIPSPGTAVALLLAPLVHARRRRSGIRR
jgi:probable HAF family extracellular repeat protein